MKNEVFYQIVLNKWHEGLKTTYKVTHCEIYTSKTKAIDEAMKMIAIMHKKQERVAGYEIQILMVRE